LVVSETVALGDRRFVSVIKFEGQRFLIGSSASSVTLLARLPDAATVMAPPDDDSNGTGSVDTRLTDGAGQ
jgi:flagellar biogenesis protein FliO